MEHLMFGEYLGDPNQIEIALNSLVEDSLKPIAFEERYRNFDLNLKIKGGDGFPITAVVLDGPIIRARVHELGWEKAKDITDIGVNPKSMRGRAHAKGYKIFYGANRKETAVNEVLQDKPSGVYEVTLGLWRGPETVRVVNFVDGSDSSFSKIPFVHSLPKEYLKEWPPLQRQSAMLLIDFFKDKFKQPYSEDLYNITNVLAGCCFSLKDIDGIGYASISDDFQGFNIALRNYENLECLEVERWKILKIDNKILPYNNVYKGKVMLNGDIIW